MSFCQTKESGRILFDTVLKKAMTRLIFEQDNSEHFPQSSSKDHVL